MVPVLSAERARQRELKKMTKPDVHEWQDITPPKIWGAYAVSQSTGAAIAGQTAARMTTTSLCPSPVLPRVRVRLFIYLLNKWEDSPLAHEVYKRVGVEPQSGRTLLRVQ